MQLCEWMKEKGWTMLGMQRKTGISRPTIKKAIMKETDITLKTAMAIHKFTKGEVTFEEMLKEVKE